MLQLILGRAGSGKTEYVYSLIKEHIEMGENNLLLITPEQFSFVNERRLLTELGESRVNFVENSSFSRLYEEVNRKFGGNRFPVLSKGAKAVMFKKAIDAVKDELELFDNSTDNVAFINSMISIYDEMKSCRVSCEDIINASENTDKKILSIKLRDISKIISSYDNMIADKYYDSANELTVLYERLLNLEYFKGRTVIIDAFTGFVAQEYKIIEIILKQAENVYITFCTDSYNNNDKFDLFSYVNSNISILKDVTSKAGVRVLDPVFLEGGHRFNNSALSHIEQYAFSNIKVSFDKDYDGISIYSAKSIADECDRVSLKISQLLRQGIRASRISVICRDMEMYKKELEFSFDKFNVPYFNDERQDISSQPLIMFVNFLLRTAIYSNRSDDVFSLLKTGLTSLDNEEICNLENYVFLWNINGSKWKKDFTESTKGFVDSITAEDREKIASINLSRQYVIDKLNKFSNCVKNATAKDISKAVYYALLSFSVDKGLKKLAVSLQNNGKSALAFEQERVWDLLMEVIDKLAVISGDENITVREYYKLFNLMISCEDLGAIPSGLDNVQIGSADRMRCDNPYAVFIVGANEGEFPKYVSSSGILSESDRITLIKNNFKLYSYGDTLNAQERFFAYNAMCAPTDYLHISYRNTKDSSTYSSIVSGILSIFPDMQVQCKHTNSDIDDIESKANAFELLASEYNNNSVFISSLKEYFLGDNEYADRINAIDALNSNSSICISDKNIASSLFGKDMYLSASRVEDYYNCAFRYFCKFGLGARPRSKAEMDPMQTGTVIHYVLEKIIKETGSDALCEISDQQIAELVESYLKTYLENKMGDSSEFSARFKYMFMRLSKLITRVVIHLKREFSQSDFVARAFELRIGKNGEPVKSQVIQLKDGGTISINGSIDRVDTYEQNGKQYVRVVDYKSGTKTFKLSDILNGLNLQMFIYLFNLCKSDNELSGISSGVLYLHSSRELYNFNRSVDPDKIKSKENDAFKMKGIVLNDEENDIAVHMERDLKGKFIPATLSKSDEIVGDIVSLADLGRLSVKIDSLLAEMGLKLHNGDINQNPIYGKNHDKTCEYCDYSDVCRNRKEITLREMIEKNSTEVLHQLMEEQADA